ncbi:MAG: DeoR/GlpR family DNA-binding transcription regulator [Propionicimonas sp.]
MSATVDADDNRLLPHERHRRILEQARSRSRVEVTALADELDVTSETIRRDLTMLERQGLVRRVHGGAVHIERLGYEPSVSARREHQVAEKTRIGRAARELLPDGGSILVDSGTTTMELVRHLPSDLALTVVTNSLPAAGLLTEFPRVELLLLGGHLREVTGASVGPWTTSALADLHVDVAFMGANGVTPELGLTTPDQAEAEVKRAMVIAASRVVCLVDHTKVGLTQLCRFARLDEVDVIITDKGLEPGFAEELANAGPEVIRA